jgi:DNA-binding protein H-NS
MDNEELRSRLEDILQRMEAIEAGLRQMRDAEAERAERRQERAARILDLAIQHEITPETVLQGYLAGRWKRRRGDVIYGRRGSAHAEVA